MDIVCKITKNQSPLCGDYDLMKYIFKVADEHNLNPKLLIGISYSESGIGKKFKPKQCSGYNNWGGIKSRKNDDGSTIGGEYPDSNGCWLYRFDTIENYFDSLANTIDQGYVQAGCNNLSCLSAFYVGTPGKPKSSRIIRTKFYMTYK